MTSRQEFGDELRRARERRGISLESIASATKIGKALLAALERGDCSRWPGGIYSRAYIKDYAKAIGLAPDEVAARFVACFESPQPESPSVSSPLPPEPASSGASALRMTLADDDTDTAGVVLRTRFLAIDLLVVLGGAALVNAATSADIWMSAAGIAIGCHMLSIVRGGSPAASIVAGWLRPSGPDRQVEEVLREV